MHACVILFKRRRTLRCTGTYFTRRYYLVELRRAIIMHFVGEADPAVRRAVRRAIFIGQMDQWVIRQRRQSGSAVNTSCHIAIVDDVVHHHETHAPTHAFSMSIEAIGGPICHAG